MTSPNHSDRDETSRGGPNVAIRELEDRARSVCRLVCFWTAVVLPFVAVGLVANGIYSLTDWSLFVSVLALNGLTLYVGHPYRESRRM